MQPTYLEAHTPKFLTRVPMQPTSLLFQDGCPHIQYGTYLLRSTHPKFVDPGADATYQASISGWMPTYSVCNLPTLKHTILMA